LKEKINYEQDGLISLIKDYFLIYISAVKLENEAAEKRDFLFDKEGNMIDTYSELITQYKNLSELVDSYLDVYGSNPEIDPIEEKLKETPKNPWLTK